MSELKRETVESLRQIIREEYSQDLSYLEAANIANGLVFYFDVLARINNKIQNEDGKDL